MAGEGEEDPDRKVYVTGTKTLSDDEVQWIFSHYGTVDSITLKPQGFGFVTMRTKDEAADAIESLEHYTYGEARLHVEHCKGKQQAGAQGGKKHSEQSHQKRQPGYKMVADNISSKTSWQDLKDLGKEVARPTYARTFTNDSGDYVGVVEFNHADERDRAIEHLDGRSLNDCKITFRQPKEDEAPGMESHPPRKDRDKYKDKDKDRARERSRERSRDKDRDRDRDRPPSRGPPRERRPPPDYRDRYRLPYERDRERVASPQHYRRSPSRDRDRSPPPRPPYWDPYYYDFWAMYPPPFPPPEEVYRRWIAPMDYDDRRSPSSRKDDRGRMEERGPPRGEPRPPRDEGRPRDGPPPGRGRPPPREGRGGPRGRGDRGPPPRDSDRRDRPRSREGDED